MAAEKKQKGLSQFLQAQAGPRAGAPASGGPRAASRSVREGTMAAAPQSGAAPPRRRTKEGKEQLLVYLRPEGIKQLKLAEIEDEYPSVSAIVAEAVNEWLVKRNRPPVA